MYLFTLTELRDGWSNLLNSKIFHLGRENRKERLSLLQNAGVLTPMCTVYIDRHTKQKAVFPNKSQECCMVSSNVSEVSAWPCYPNVSKLHNI